VARRGVLRGVKVASFYAPRFEKWSGVDYDSLLMLLDASVWRLGFGFEHVVISDSERPAPLKTARFDLPDNLMAAILDGQRQFLAATPGPVLLVGADCLLTRNPRPVLSEGIDMAVTIGPFSDCPMNTGAIWCADGPTCAPVWQAALDREPREWGEDQTTLYAAVKNSGLRVREVCAEQTNWAASGPADDAGMPVVVHFRGRRKAFMAEWARRHLFL
jgi:hypothetical protein